MMNNIKLRVALVGIACLVSLSGCNALKKEEPGYRGAVSVAPLQVESSGSCGNDPSYTLNGKTYRVLDSADGYREEGMGSWYGAEFQGVSTAGCEAFDMNGFSAAHRTLPLPSYVRVTEIKSGKSVIVRVNDRGPFESDGLIQLSYAAANALGMTQQRGASKVRVEGLDAPPESASVVSNTSAASSKIAGVAKPSAEQVKAIQKAKESGKSFYVVVNNYPDQGEALDMFVRLTSVGLSKTEMASAMEGGRAVHQVRIGPLYTQDQIDNVKDALENNGLATFRVIAVGQ